MPGTTLPRDQDALLGGPNGVFARVERVERRTNAPITNAPIEMVFTYPGTLEAGVESPPWYPHLNGALRTVRVSLRVAATANHVIEVRVNGAAVQQFTLSTGQLTTIASVAIAVPAAGYVTVKTITVADADLSVQLISS